MLGTIYRSGVMSDIYHSSVQFNLAYKFCSYTINTISQSADIKLSLPANKKITIYWGDGTSIVITGAVTQTTYSHTYTDIGTYNLTVSGDYNDITYLNFDGDGYYGGDIKNLPRNLKEFRIYKSNSWVGNIKNLPETLTYIFIGGMTWDAIYSTITGSIEDLPPLLEKAYIYGGNTITGLLTLPVNIISFYIIGFNTIQGDMFVIPDSCTDIYIRGNNIISEYSGKTWITNFNIFRLEPVSPGGLSSAEMDLLLNDLDEDLDWSGGGIIELTGTNEPPTGIGQAAIDNIVAEGGTVFVNDYTFCSYTTNTTNQSADIKLSLPAGKKITIFWGDGESTIITGEVIQTIFSHTYTDIGTYNLTVSGDYNDISYLRFYGDGEYSGDIKYFPNNLIEFLCTVDNIFTGEISSFSNNLENFMLYGGHNTITGDIKDAPPLLTNIVILGYNTLYGNVINFNSNLISILIGGHNTITGDIKDFSISNIKISLTGKNTLFGDLALIKDDVYYLYIAGHNTISDYSGKTWTTNFDIFKVVPYSGGLSSAEIDQLIIDLDEDLDWSGGGIIYLTGTNAPRTSASDAAVNNIEAEGGTIFTN